MIRFTGLKFDTWQTSFSLVTPKRLHAEESRRNRDGSTKLGITSIGFSVAKFFAVSHRSHSETAVTPSETSIPNFVIGR